MKKTVILTACMFLVTSAFAGEQIVVASAASAKSQSKPIVAKKVASKASEKPATADYALESFGCCGLPQ
jgi:hypothetical protein